MKIKAKLLNSTARYPEYMTTGAAGADIFSNAPNMGIKIHEGESAIVPTGISVEIPTGYELQIRSRSGLAKEGIVVLNSPGTIDSDYRGEILVLLHNFGNKPVMIKTGDRIAQAVLNKIYRCDFESSELSKTPRSSSGFGSTKT